MALGKFGFRTMQTVNQYGQLKKNSWSILSILGFYGPQSIPSIEKITTGSKYYFLKPKFRKFTSHSNWKLKYTPIEREIESLIDKGLVKKLHFAFLRKKTEYFGLTFSGLLWYFRESGKQLHTIDRISFFFSRYEEPYDALRSKHRKNHFITEGFRELVPFCPLWVGLVKQIGNKCLETLEMTVTNFYIDDKTPLQIEPLGLNVETYPNYSGEITDKPIFIERNEKDPVVANYLKKKEAVLLTEAYIAYLLNEDFNLLHEINPDKVEQKLSELKSFKEYDFFENEDRQYKQFFSEENLAKFFPKYSGIEYYFKGMFVNNLLWYDKRTET